MLWARQIHHCADFVSRVVPVTSDLKTDFAVQSMFTALWEESYSMRFLKFKLCTYRCLAEWGEIEKD